MRPDRPRGATTSVRHTRRARLGGGVFGRNRRATHEPAACKVDTSTSMARRGSRADERQRPPGSGVIRNATCVAKRAPALDTERTSDAARHIPGGGRPRRTGAGSRHHGAPIARRPRMSTRRIEMGAAEIDIVPPPATATAARRRRPSSKDPFVETIPERRAREARAARKESAQAAKRSLLAKTAARREDKRESPNDFDTNASPRNLKAEKNDKRSKGKATHQLESSNPGKRPSRKSSRGGANHIKPDSQQRRQVTRAVRSAKNRSAMRSG